MSTQTMTPPRFFTREDGRARVGIPFWNGILSALAAAAIAFAAAFVATIALLFGVILVTGRQPLLSVGHPLAATTEVIFYVAGGWFAWVRLRATGRVPFRVLDAHAWRTVLLGIAALFAVRVATVIQLVHTAQTKHVQTGFEHFDVVSKAPGFTALAIGLAVLSMVVIGPLAEEIAFRGLLFGALAPNLGVLGSALVTAVLFGAAHGDWVLFPSLAALGFISALAYAATGNLWVSVILHALNNALGATFLVAGSLHHG
ncbi:MAG: CPBP family intramembrane metalloprotease [Candidatus Eremiobacteraeota bacterium]|nr:CPBP family intramembrane metalloprotease [Candidatus Eremiobacteraeota bacterium]